MCSSVELMRRLSRPLEAVSAGVRARPAVFEGIRGVVFDVYGTLVISASGDIGVAAADQQEVVIRSILGDLGVPVPRGVVSLSQRLVQLIREDHDRSRAAGIEYPEVEIREIWGELLGIEDGGLLESVAIAHECATNPVWPMPGAAELLGELERGGLVLGIVSNAQFYTPVMFEALFGESLEGLGFDPELCHFSYRHRRAKPGCRLFERLCESLGGRGMDPGEVLYIGNDALNDIHPAAKLGLRTVLFAGDRRSYRPRVEMRGLRPPDAVITGLDEVPGLLGRQGLEGGK